MKKIIAPLVVTIVIILYFFVYFAFLLSLMDDLVLKLIFGIVPFVFAVIMICVCIERIKEIRSNEEDDLSKY